MRHMMEEARAAIEESTEPEYADFEEPDALDHAKAGFSDRVLQTFQRAEDFFKPREVPVVRHSKSAYRDKIPVVRMETLPSQYAEWSESMKKRMRPSMKSALVFGLTLAGTLVPSFSTNSSPVLSPEHAQVRTFSTPAVLEDPSMLGACYTKCTNPITWRMHADPECRSYSSLQVVQ